MQFACGLPGRRSRPSRARVAGSPAVTEPTWRVPAGPGVLGLDHRAAACGKVVRGQGQAVQRRWELQVVVGNAGQPGQKRDGDRWVAAEQCTIATAAEREMVVNDTRITAVTPGGQGVGAVTVITPGGTSNSVPFYYIRPPVIQTLVPGAGLVEGGTTVTITGRYLSTVSQVAVGPTVVTVTVLSDSRLTITTPPMTAGTVPLVITTGGGVADDATYTYVSRPEGHEFPVDPCPARPTATKDGSPPKLVPCPHEFAGWRGYDPRVAEHHHAHRRTAALPVSEQVEVGRQAVGEAAQGRGSRRRGQRRATRAVGSRCGWPSTRRRTGRVRWPLRRTWPARPRNPVLMGEFMAAYQEAREMPVFTILLMLRLHAGDELNAQAGVGTWCGVRAGPSADVCAEDRLSAGDSGVGQYKQCPQQSVPQQCGRVPAAEPEFGEEASSSGRRRRARRLPARPRSAC